MRLLFATFSALLVVTAIRSEPPAWPQFRGPGGVGVADNQKPPIECGPDKNLLWKVPVPSGSSSPVVADGRLFLTAFDKGKLWTIAYQQADGKELWRREAPAKKIEPFHKTEGSPAASTPVTDGERVVAYFGSCGLFCYDLDGKEQWRYEMECARTHSGFGTGTSPVLADGLVLLVRDLANDTRALAVDVKNGRKVWEQPRAGAQTAYSTPCIWDTGAGKELVVAGALRLTSYDVKTGKEKWSYAGLPAMACTSPVADGELLLYAGCIMGGSEDKMPGFDDILKEADANKDGFLSWEEAEKMTKPGVERESFRGFFEAFDTNKDGKLSREEWDAMAKFFSQGKDVALAIKPGHKGVLAEKDLVWNQSKGLPYISTALPYRGRLFMVNMQGMASAYDIKTGAPVFQQERVAGVGGRGCYASPVAANGHIYLCSLEGRLVVLEAGEKVKVVSRADLGENISATPAIADDMLIVRTAGHLFAFGQKK